LLPIFLFILRSASFALARVVFQARVEIVVSELVEDVFKPGVDFFGHFDV
jgi:hypothetical protein